MKKLYCIITALTALVFTAHAQVVRDLYIPGELYVKFRIEPQEFSQYIPYPGYNPNYKSAPDVINSYELVYFKKAFPGLQEMADVYRIKLTDISKTEELLDQLLHRRDVEYAELIPYAYIDHVPYEYDEGKQWYFKTINMGWPNMQMSTTINIAVIDNAVRYTHEDLIRKLMYNQGEVAGDGIDNDGNGYIDDYYGVDLADGDGNPTPPPPPNSPRTPANYFCHGTHVAGLVAADNENNIGIASLSSDNHVLCIKATSDNTENHSILTHYSEGIAYAIQRDVDVINCSWELSAEAASVQTLTTLIQLARQKGIVIVAAAGNGGANVPVYPAALDGVIGVGYTDKNDVKGAYSNYGNYVDVMAPGEDIYSTLAYSDNHYGRMTGSSMAAPIVSGLVGLILSQNTTFTPDQIEILIKSGCDNIDAKNSGFAGKLGAGRINVDKALDDMLIFTSVHPVTSEYADFTVYPNPASIQINLPVELLSPSGEPFTLKIFNSAGAEVYTEQVTQGNPVDISQLAPGIYYLTTLTQNGQNYRTRLAVSR